MEIKTQNKKIMITETILRDAHQSQAATRMRLDEMLPVLEQLDDIGYYSLEAWGGATFDSCLRFLNEDPWERLRTLKAHLKKTPIQMLLRGQNLLGYRHYADDLVEKFVEKSIENGVGVVRVFDALNDPRNLETSMKAIKKYGGVCEATICYTTGPVYTEEYFVKLGKQLEDMGADNICLKDMANLLLPFDTYKLVKALKEAEAYHGPSLIICYAPCINHGINMGRSQTEEKNAVDCGYWQLFRYNPTLTEKGENPFTLDSKDPTGDYQAFLQGEVRYASLKKTEPALAEELYKETEEASRERLAGYKKMAGK